jgi:prenylcysteine alpha-carboxyl methylesterase
MLVLDLVFMTIYVILLLPGFLQMAWFYVTTNRIAVQYKSDSCRNSLDVYPCTKAYQQYPNQHQAKSPVVLFLPGGAYMIGYKMWATLLAQALVPAGILVIAADYRNYPFGTVPAMVQDAEDVLQWTFEHCEEYGGDPNQIILVGQSAGAHLGMMAVLRRHWKIKGFVGLSGVYNMREVTRHFARHGLPYDFVEQCLFQSQMDECDPSKLILLEATTKPPPLPPIELWHGTADKTVSHDHVRRLAPLAREWELHTHTNSC